MTRAIGKASVASVPSRLIVCSSCRPRWKFLKRSSSALIS